MGDTALDLGRALALQVAEEHKILALEARTHRPSAKPYSSSRPKIIKILNF